MVFTLNFIAEFKFSAMNGLSFINTLTANYHYSRSNKENLSLPFQMQLSEKPKTFCQCFIAFLESTLNLNTLKKKCLIAQAFLKLLTPKDVLT